jgi:hypothetical protein
MFQLPGDLMELEMKTLKHIISVALMMVALSTPSAATTRLIVRDGLGLIHLKSSCLLLGCTVQWGLGDPSNQVFLVTTNLLNPLSLIKSLSLNLGIVDIELDQVMKVQAATAGDIPAALYDQTPMPYYGSTVWHGYVNQPAAQLIQLAKTQSAYGVTGAGIVAIIDTGVDPSHPALKPVLLNGYDFVHNKGGADEKGDVTQSSAAVLDGAQPAYVNQSSAAVLDQSSAAVLDSGNYAAFGHGTMVAGVVHLVAPTTKILPLKAFSADGSGYASDVMRALYYAQKNGADVVNMSFSFASSSQELSNAVKSVASNGVVLVASAGNDGKAVLVYPAAYPDVMGVASTDNNDIRSSFSNYGSNLVWVAAPGEGVVTMYPYGTYAACWGTSFSAPMAAGTAALLVQVSQSVKESTASSSLAHADWISSELNNGRLNTYTAVTAWRAALGIR